MSFLQRQPRATHDDIKKINGKAAQATPLYENSGGAYIGSYFKVTILTTSHISKQVCR